MVMVTVGKGTLWFGGGLRVDLREGYGYFLPNPGQNAVSEKSPTAAGKCAIFF
jgi:hypothetical protein